MKLPYLTNRPGCPLRLVFVRHGTARDVEGRCIGHTDVPLSEAGARSVGELEFDCPIDKIVSSDLSRAAASARILSQQLALPVAVDDRLRELYFGDWDGRTWNDIETCDGQRFSEWMAAWTTACPPNGETVDALVTRVAGWLHEQFRDTQSRGSTILAVAHAGSIRAAICQLTSMPIQQMFDIPVEYGRATVVEVSANLATVSQVNTRAIRAIARPAAR